MIPRATGSSTLDEPARAVRCACATSDDVRELGRRKYPRQPEHRGETLRPSIATLFFFYSAASRLISNFKEVFSSMVRDLMPGSGFSFDDRGTHGTARRSRGMAGLRRDGRRRRGAVPPLSKAEATESAGAPSKPHRCSSVVVEQLGVISMVLRHRHRGHAARDADSPDCSTGGLLRRPPVISAREE